MKAAVTGSLLGTAAGDALGLPYEGLSRRRAARLFGPPDRHRLLFGRGMVSDDTEHACMTLQALIASGGEVDAFRRSLARRLRFWLLGLPAGTGLATARAIFKLWLGVDPERSGVFSAGNGPAIRAPIIGAAVGDRSRLKELVRASTRITHVDPKAEHGALAVALAARMAADGDPTSAFLDELAELLDGEAPALLSLLAEAEKSARSGQSTVDFAAGLGCENGVSGYVHHCVPVVIHAWLRHPQDFSAAVTAVVRCGGDADSTAAMVGGIVGAAVGEAGIPRRWLDGLWEWPRSVAWLRRLSAAAGGSAPPRLAVYAIFPRNLLFLAVVLAHGFRRLLPPY